jgi:C1A family cysteine protease
VARKIQRYGWKPSLPDHNRAIADTTSLAALPEVDPRTELPPIFDQGQLGSCTANASAAAFQYDAILDGKDPGMLARLWIYWQERSLEGTLSHGDCGAEGHDAFKLASTIGIPPETDWPYNWPGGIDAGPPPSDYFTPPEPPATATGDEGHYKLTKPVVTPPQTELAFKQVLSNKQTIAFGFTVYESFEGSEVASTGIVPMPTQSEKQVGGHLKHEPHYGLVRNSWGSEQTSSAAWGLDGDGYFLMPWTYILSASLAGDWTTIVRSLAS